MSADERGWLRGDDGEDPISDPIDGLAVLKAELEQVAMHMPLIAENARQWFKAFQDEGFTEKQALYLTAVEIIRSPGEIT
jgi:hypothetical protein